MDYTKFLGKKEEVVLAYLGGAHVFGKDRRLRVDEPRPPRGFHRFEVQGRNARALGPAEPALEDLPRVTGHHVGGFVVHGSSAMDRVALLPEEEPPVFAKLRARRWWSGDVVFESLDFDTEVEEEARLRLERGASLADLKGVPSTLRLAFGIAVMLRAAERGAVPLAVREAQGHAVRAADDPAAATTILDDLQRERAAFQARAIREATEARDAERLRRLLASAPHGALRARAHERPTLENAVGRAEDALDSANARMLSTRRLTQGQLEVAFEFLGERFISVVDAMTLQILDSGVCLAGEDDLVTLESLPGVIREAIDTHRLVITRR